MGPRDYRTIGLSETGHSAVVAFRAEMLARMQAVTTQVGWFLSEQDMQALSEAYQRGDTRRECIRLYMTALENRMCRTPASTEEQDVLITALNAATGWTWPTCTEVRTQARREGERLTREHFAQMETEARRRQLAASDAIMSVPPCTGRPSGLGLYLSEQQDAGQQTVQKCTDAFYEACHQDQMQRLSQEFTPEIETAEPVRLTTFEKGIIWGMVTVAAVGGLLTLGNQLLPLVIPVP